MTIHLHVLPNVHLGAPPFIFWLSVRRPAKLDTFGLLDGVGLNGDGHDDDEEEDDEIRQSM